MKKMEWMVAAGAVAALAGATYSAGCVNTTSDCALLGTCGEGGGTSSSTATTVTSSTGTGTSTEPEICASGRFGDVEPQAGRSIHVGMSGEVLLAGAFNGSLSIGDKNVTNVEMGDNVFVASLKSASEASSLRSFAVPYKASAFDPAGGVVLAGSYTTMADFGCLPALDATSDLYVVKLNNAGECVWNKGFSAPNAGVSVAVAANGHIALAGDSEGPMDFHGPKPGPLSITGGKGGKRDIFVVELDPEGSVISAIGYGGGEDDTASGVAFDSMGGILVTGTFKSPTLDLATGQNALKNPAGTEQAFVVRKGPGMSWFLGFPGGEQHPTAIAVDGGQAIVAGDFTGTLGTLKATGTAFFLLGLDIAQGTFTWGQAFDGAGKKTIHALATDGAGTIALSGTIAGDVDFGLGKLASPAGFVVARLNAAKGLALSSQVFSGDKSDPVGYGVTFEGSKVLVTGSFASTLVLNAEKGKEVSLESAGTTDVFVAKLCP